MAAPSKCFICSKTAYPLESWAVREWVYHKACFKCSDCKVKLTLKTYRIDVQSGVLFCATHKPKETPKSDMNGMEFQRAKLGPKVGVINEQVRGELAGQGATLDLDSLHIRSHVDAPKIGVINEQVRGELAGQGGSVGADSLYIKSRVDAPRVGVINEQVRGELAGVKSSETAESMSISNRLKAPKAGLVNAQVRGELAGQKPEETYDSISFKNRLNTPKQGLVNEHMRLQVDRDRKADAFAPDKKIQPNNPDEFLVEERQTAAEPQARISRSDLSSEGALAKSKQELARGPSVRDPSSSRVAPPSPDLHAQMGLATRTMSPEEQARAAQAALELAAMKEAAIAAQRAAAVAAYGKPSPSSPPMPTSAHPERASAENVYVEASGTYEETYGATYMNPDDAIASGDLYEDIASNTYEDPSVYMEVK